MRASVEVYNSSTLASRPRTRDLSASSSIVAAEGDGTSETVAAAVVLFSGAGSLFNFLGFLLGRLASGASLPFTLFFAGGGGGGGAIVLLEGVVEVLPF